MEVQEAYSDSPHTNVKKWYDEFEKSELVSKHSKSEIDVINLKTEAKKCLDSESTAYHLKQSKSKDSEYSWLKTAISKGTTSDRVAAGIVLVQNSPKHNLNHLNSLISQVKVAKHNQCTMIIQSLKDLFLNDLLHPHYNLLKFEDQDLKVLECYEKSFEVDKDGNLKYRPSISKNKLLALWYFEDQLKEIYERFINSLSVIANDTVDKNREKAIATLNELMVGNFEQQQKLMDLIINKLGDPTSKVASKSVFCLNNFLRKHPQMKMVILQQVEKFLFRSNIAPRAQYFAICLLTQFLLKKEDSEIATTLIDVYFAYFKACLKKGEPDSRMMAAILAGVNRAYRYADNSSEKLSEHIDSVYKVVHVGSFNVSLNALCLLFQVVGKDPKLSERFFSTFYRKLLDSNIATANKRSMFLNLLFRVMRSDESVVRLQAFVKRILQVSLHFPANFICAILYVLSQVLHAKKLKNKILTKQKTAMKNESVINIDESLDNEPVADEEIYSKNTVVLSNVISIVPEDKNKDENIEIKKEFKASCYDPMARNPLHSGANLSFYCELTALTKHFHPSVSLFSKTLLQGRPIVYTGDPLEDLNLIRFLDRYVFKNPKKLEAKKVVRKNDPLAMRSGYAPKGIRTLPVGSQAYLNEREDRIPVDELFLYRYLHERNELKQLQTSNKLTDEDDNESVNSEDFNEMLDQMSKKKKFDDYDQLDIASDFKPTKNKSKGGNAEIDEDSEDEATDDSEDEVDDFSDSASNDQDNESDVEDSMTDDLDLENVDDDLSDMEFNDSDNELEEISSNKRKNRESFDGKNSKKQKGINANTFVPVEEFAEMLEKQKKFKHGASQSLSDRDGASVKQLDWETERNEKIKGYGRDRFNSRKKPFKNFKKEFKNKKKGKW